MTRFFKTIASAAILLSLPSVEAETLYGNVAHSDRVDHVTTNLQKHAPHVLSAPPPAPSINSPLPPAPSFRVPEPPGTSSYSGNTSANTQTGSADQSTQSAGYIPAYGVGHAQTAEQQPRSTLLQGGTSTLNYNIEWFRIPKWMGGSWIKDGDLTTSETDLRTGMSSAKAIWTENKLQVNWGHQMDAAGNIWHVNLLPSERDGVSAGRQVRFVTLRQKCEQSTDANLITRTFYAVGEYDSLRGQPIDSFQQESINHYALDSKGTLVNSSTNRVFNYAGNPVRDGQLLSKHTKIGPFVALDNLRGVDLKAALKDYLSSQGMDNLIPKDASDAQN